MDGTIIISYFGGSNNIFADCTYIKIFISMIDFKNSFMNNTYSYIHMNIKLFCIDINYLKASVKFKPTIQIR